MAKPVTKTQNDKKNTAAGCGCLMVIVIIMAIFFAFKPDSSEDIVRDHKLSAYTYAQMVVEKNLKSPSTAKFSVFNENFVKELNDNEYTVQGYVDAENSFGAAIRNRFIVTVKLDDEGNPVSFRDFQLTSP